MWKAKYLYTGLLCVLVCPAFVKILFCEAERHPLFKELYSSRVCDVGCHVFVQMFIEYVGTPYICTYSFSVMRYGNALVKQLEISTM